MTRKEFVLTVVDQLKENPRQVLAGHGISAAVLQTIVNRPDVMGKLATILYSLNGAKKGAAGLKKAANFRIFGYRTFGELNGKGREDIEGFIGGLPAEDAATFTNSDNIITILLLPDTVDNGDDVTAASIISGKSVGLTFDSAVRKEYKVSGGMYLVIAFGDSAIRTTELAAAKRTEKTNKRKQIKRTPAKIAAELKAKARKKLAALDAKRAALQATKMATQKQLQQYAAIGSQFGVKGGNPISVKGGMNKYDASVAADMEAVKAEVAALDPVDKKSFNLAVTYMKSGKTKMARMLMRELQNPILENFVMNGAKAPQTSDKLIDARKKAIKDQIKALTIKNESLMVDLSLAPTPNLKLSIKSSISRNNSKIKELRAKLGTYKNMSVTAMRNKAAMLKQVNADIEANIAAGESINEALNAALENLAAKPEQKQIIKQQVIQQVANGTPMQFAVQQAVQDNIQEVPAMQAPAISDSMSIDDLLSLL